MQPTLLWVVVLAAPMQGASQAPEAAPVEAPAPSSRPVGLDKGGMAGFGGFGGLGGSGPGLRATWMPSQRVKGQDARMGWVAEDLALGYPLWTDGQTRVLGNLGVGAHQFATDAVLPESGKPFPEQLWNLRAGMTAIHPLGDGWMLAGGFNVGSASDRPFSTFSTVNAGVNALLRIPRGERDSWMLGIMYSPLGQIPYPLPGVAYLYNPHDSFQASIGVPLSVRWRPDERWTLEASYMLLTVIRTRATWQVEERWWVYGGYEWTNQGWFLSDELRSRQDAGDRASDRFRYFEMRLGGGVRYSGALATFDLGAGYAFDRFFTQGSLFGSDPRDRLELGAGPYLSASLRW